MPVHRMYPSSMSNIIHCPFKGYSYTGLRDFRRQNGYTTAGIGHLHVSTGVVAGNITRLGDMVVGTGEGRIRLAVGRVVRTWRGEGILCMRHTKRHVSEAFAGDDARQQARH